MLKKIRKDWRLWLAVMAFGAVLSFAVRLSSVVDAVELEAFFGQWSEKVRAFDMVLNEVDDFVYADDDWETYDYAAHLNPTVGDFDERPGVFAALYNNKFQLLSNRKVVFNEVMLEPMSDPALMEAVQASERGEITLTFPYGYSHYNWIRVYYRWVPTGEQHSDRLLAVIAMWPGAMDGNPGDKLTSWCVGLLTLATLETIMIAIAFVPRKERQHEGK